MNIFNWSCWMNFRSSNTEKFRRKLEFSNDEELISVHENNIVWENNQEAINTTFIISFAKTTMATAEVTQIASNLSDPPNHRIQLPEAPSRDHHAIQLSSMFSNCTVSSAGNNCIPCPANQQQYLTSIHSAETFSSWTLRRDSKVGNSARTENPVRPVSMDRDDHNYLLCLSRCLFRPVARKAFGRPSWSCTGGRPILRTCLELELHHYWVLHSKRVQLVRTSTAPKRLISLLTLSGHGVQNSIALEVGYWRQLKRVPVRLFAPTSAGGQVVGGWDI